MEYMKLFKTLGEYKEFVCNDYCVVKWDMQCHA